MNDDLQYPTVIYELDRDDLLTFVEIDGDINIKFFGFGPKGKNQTILAKNRCIGTVFQTSFI